MAKKERKTKSKSVCVCREKRNDATDNLRSNIFWVFFFFLSFLLMSLCVCVRRSRPKGNKTFHLAKRFSNVPRHNDM